MEDKTKMEEEKIVLTLEKPEENNTVETTEKVEEEKPVKTELDMSVFSDEELKMIDDFSEKIDISDTNIIMSYGSTAQNKISDFSDKTLENMKTKDLGQIGNMITDLVTELKGFDVEEESKGFLGFFKNILIRNLRASRIFGKSHKNLHLNKKQIYNIILASQKKCEKILTLSDKM